MNQKPGYWAILHDSLPVFIDFNFISTAFMINQPLFVDFMYDITYCFIRVNKLLETLNTEEL